MPPPTAAAAAAAAPSEIFLLRLIIGRPVGVASGKQASALPPTTHAGCRPTGLACPAPVFWIDCAGVSIACCYAERRLVTSCDNHRPLIVDESTGARARCRHPYSVPHLVSADAAAAGTRPNRCPSVRGPTAVGALGRCRAE